MSCSGVASHPGGNNNISGCSAHRNRAGSSFICSFDSPLCITVSTNGYKCLARACKVNSLYGRRLQDQLSLPASTIHFAPLFSAEYGLNTDKQKIVFFRQLYLDIKKQIEEIDQSKKEQVSRLLPSFTSLIQVRFGHGKVHSVFIVWFIL